MSKSNGATVPIPQVRHDEARLAVVDRADPRPVVGRGVSALDGVAGQR